MLKKSIVLVSVLSCLVFAGGVVESELYKDDEITIKVERKVPDPVIVEKIVEVPVRDTLFEDELKMDIELTGKSILVINQKNRSWELIILIY